MERLVFDLSVPRDKYEVEVSGDFVAVEKCDGDVYAEFRTPEGVTKPVNLKIVRAQKIKFSSIYLTHVAQTGSLILITYGEGEIVILATPVIVAGDEAGLAKSTQLPASLTAAGNLKVSVEGTSIKQPVDIQDHWVESVTISASSAKTASGNTADVEVGRFVCAEVCLDVTAVSGTSPTLDFYLEGKDQYSGKYKVIWSQTGITAVGTFWLTITTLAFRYIRARWVIGGTTPSFTFSVSMEAKS